MINLFTLCICSCLSLSSTTLEPAHRWNSPRTSGRDIPGAHLTPAGERFVVPLACLGCNKCNTFKEIIPCLLCWRLPLLFLKMFFLVTVGFILRSQSKSWLSGYGTHCHQVVCDVLPISNWKNILRISIILFLCGRIGGLFITLHHHSSLAQLCPFSVWTHQAAMSGSPFLCTS